MITPHDGFRRLVPIVAIVLAGCRTVGDGEIYRPEVPVAVGEASTYAELLAQPQYQVLRGAAPDELPGSPGWQKRAIANSVLTGYYRDQESAYYRSQSIGEASHEYPCNCIALSGGGMRALAFSSGVLAALHDIDVYQRTDVLSAVSGGAYASYWILSNAKSGATEAAMLAGPDSPQLTHLRRRANSLMSIATQANMAYGMAMKLPTDPGWLIAKAYDVIAGMVPKPQFAPTPTNMAYGNSIHIMVNDSSVLAATRPIRNYEELTRSGRVPLMVWLTTARPADLPDCTGTEAASELAERNRSVNWAAYEVSPLRIGSESLGFAAPGELGTLDALAASGAAVNIPFNDRCRLFSLIDSSVRMRNLRAPAPAFAESREKQPRTALLPDFLLIDGGLADNLGLFPLIRRLCSDITVVDSEFDPYLVFPAYTYLKVQLSRLDIPLTVPGVEALAARNRSPALPGDPGVDCVNGMCLVRERPECRSTDDASCVGPHKVVQPIFEGQIGPIPVAAREPDDHGGQRWNFGERSLRVHYVKLALDADHIDMYPATVRDRYRVSNGNRGQEGGECTATRDTGACRFPQESTSDLDYRDGQFEAYWDLGRCTIERYWNGAGHPGDARCADSEWPPVQPQDPPSSN